MAFGIIIIGDEILSGRRSDKHLAKIIELLGERGHRREIGFPVVDDEFDRATEHTTRGIDLLHREEGTIGGRLVDGGQPAGEVVRRAEPWRRTTSYFAVAVLVRRLTTIPACVLPMPSACLWFYTQKQKH